jgi:ribosomal protein S18 acetylase RimI-like enzyme
VPAVIPLVAARRVEAAGLLARAFHDDPLWAWVVPDPDRRRRGLPWLFERALGELAAARIETLPGPLVSLATWLPPGSSPAPPALSTLAGSVRRLGGGLPRLVRYTRAAAALEREAGVAGAWLLGGLAVEPAEQGRGLGSTLLEEGLRRSDAAGSPVLLLTSSPRNVRFYERHGFEVAGERPLPSGGPNGWAMVRPPA